MGRFFFFTQFTLMLWADENNNDMLITGPLTDGCSQMQVAAHSYPFPPQTS